MIVYGGGTMGVDGGEASEARWREIQPSQTPTGKPTQGESTHHHRHTNTPKHGKHTRDNILQGVGGGLCWAGVLESVSVVYVLGGLHKNKGVERTILTRIDTS